MIMAISLGDEVTRILFISDNNLHEWFDQINREHGRAYYAIAMELCDEYLDQCAHEITVKGDLCRATILVHRGAVCQDWGDPDKAQTDYLAASQIFSISREEYSQWNEAVAIYGLALVAQSLRQWGRAKNHLDNALRAFQTYGDGSLKSNLAVVQAKSRRRELRRMHQSESEGFQSPDEIPVIGRASGGMPIVALPVTLESGLPDRLVFDHQSFRIKGFMDSSRSGPRDFWTSENKFAAYVHGDSMKEAGIDDGNYVIFRRQARPDIGDIVVVSIDDIDDVGIVYSTVKRFAKRGGKIVLRAANAEFSPQEQFFVESDPRIEFIGKVVAVAEIV